MSSFSIVIPARINSSRLPGKMLVDIAGKPMICHVVDRANESVAQRVIVATDSVSIADALRGANCEVCITRADHETGSDRLQEVVQKLDFSDDEIVVNVQGDEPMIPGKLINQVANGLKADHDASMSTAAKLLENAEDIDNPNVVKVVFAQNHRALYFSRAPIPYAVKTRIAPVWHHIGIYAYRAGFLRNYDQLLESATERTESLEQLRVLDNGHIIRVETVDYSTGVGVDTHADLEQVRALMA